MTWLSIKLSKCLRSSWRCPLVVVTLIAVLAPATPALAQLDDARYGEVVPRDVREMYDRGLAYLVAQQSEQGDWIGAGDNGPGVTGLCLLAILASGEDPNFGLYSGTIRRALRNMIEGQNASTGILGSSMYHHGFAMLALAEAYGAVDDRDLWPSGGGQRRTIGQALELAVRAAVTSQKKNQFGGWRYSPDAMDADTSVSGAVLVGLLAARNAGIEVPDESIDKAIAYYTSMTADSGEVAYAGGIGGGGPGNSLARSSIATLGFALAKRKDLPQFKSALGLLTSNLEQQGSSWPDYARYYQSQALFQGDLEAWETWNTLLIRQLKQAQQPDGSFQGQFGAPLTTSMSLLAMALNYRLLPIYER